jgi:hypothetical protein
MSGRGGGGIRLLVRKVKKRRERVRETCKGENNDIEKVYN